MRPASSKSAAAAPASLTSGLKSGATKRQRKAAAPLGDVTNLLALAETPTPTPTKPRTRTRSTARRPLPAPSDASGVSSTGSSSASVTPAPPKRSSAARVTPAPKPSSSAARVTPARKPSSAAGDTPAPKPSSAARVVTPAPKPSSAAVAGLEEERSVLKSPTVATVYRRTTTEARGRWRRNPAAAAANSRGKEPVAATASCPPLGKSARTSSRKKNTRPISASDPCHEGKKKRAIASTSNLLEDLLEKQRAYFAELDTFELVEEEVSESEME